MNPSTSEKRAIFLIMIPRKERYVCEGFASVVAYARKYNIDLIVRHQNIHTTSDKFDMEKGTYPVMEKLAIGELLGIYDRILYIDSDVLITKHAPNIFEAYPGAAGLNESRFQTNVLHCYHQLFCTLGRIDLPGFRDEKVGDRPFYYNGGVFLFDQKSRIIFADMAMNLEVWRNKLQHIGWGEQSWFTYLLSKYKVPVSEMDPRFNFLLGLQNENVDKRLEAYFIHYTGPTPWHRDVLYEDLKKPEILR